MATTPARKTTPTRSRKAAETANAEAAAPAKATKPAFVVVEENLHFQPRKGAEIVLNLDLSFRAIASIQDLFGDDEDEVDRDFSIADLEEFFSIISNGDQPLVDRIMGQLGRSESTPLLSRYMQEMSAFTEGETGVDLGE